MGKFRGKVTFAVAVLIIAIADEFIANQANVLSIHSHMTACYIHIALIAEEVSVTVIAIADLLIAILAIMLIDIFVSTIDDSIASIAIVIFVTVDMLTREFSAASGLVTVSVPVAI